MAAAYLSMRCRASLRCLQLLDESLFETVPALLPAMPVIRHVFCEAGLIVEILLTARDRSEFVQVLVAEHPIDALVPLQRSLLGIGGGSAALLYQAVHLDDVPVHLLL